MENDTNEIEEETLSDLLDEFIEGERLHFEMDSGVENLSKVAQAIGYNGHGYKYGSPLEEFLSDNPGAQSALIGWIREQNIQEWKDNLEAELPEEEFADEEEDETPTDLPPGTESTP